MRLRCQTDKPTSLLLQGTVPRPEGYPRYLETTGQHIKAVRLDRRLLQCEVAKFIGVSERTIINWETGKGSIQFKHYPKIISFLGYHPFAEKQDSVKDVMRIYRQIKGISINELAKKLNLDENTISNYCRGKISRKRHVRDKIEKEIHELISYSTL